MAEDINNVILVGRLVRDADLKYINTGTACCSFSIAVNKRKKEGDNWVDAASFFDVTVWGKQAENINQYLQKGKQVAVTGSLRQDRWEQDGQNRSKVVIEADRVQLLGGKDNNTSGGQQKNYNNGNFPPPPSGNNTASVNNSGIPNF